MTLKPGIAGRASAGRQARGARPQARTARAAREHLQPLHPPAGRDLADRRAFLVFGIVAYLQPAGGGPAAGGLPDHPGQRQPAGRQPARPWPRTSRTPLERQFSLIPGVTQMTSVSSLGSTSITLQFDLSRNIDAAAAGRAGGDQRRQRPAAHQPARRRRRIRKVNPADAPIMIMALTSDTLPLSTGRRLRRQHPVASRSRASTASARSTSAASRSRRCASSIDPRKVAALGLQLDTVRTDHRQPAPSTRPRARSPARCRTCTVYANDQILDADDLEQPGRRLPATARRSGSATSASAIQGVENNQVGAWVYPGQGQHGQDAAAAAGRSC